MAGTVKLTEKETANLKDTASFVVTQPELVDDTEREAVRRVPLAKVKRDLTNNLAPGIVSEAAGSVITLDDSSNMPLQSLTIYGKSTQDGTPTPEAPVEIVSVENPEVVVRALNLLNLELFNEFNVDNDAVKITTNSDASFIIIGKKTKLDSNVLLYAVITMNDVRKLFRPGRLHLKAARSFPYLFITFLRSDKTVVFELTNNKRDYIAADIPDDFFGDDDNIVRIGIFGDTAPDIVSATVRPMLYQEGDGTWTPYKPPQSLTFPYTLRGIPVTSGGNYTDESGQQWICDTIEVNADGTGKLVRMVKEEEITSCRFTSLYEPKGLYYFSLQITESIYDEIFCTHLLYTKGSGMSVGHLYINGNRTTVTCVLNDQTLTTKALVDTWLTEQKNNGTPFTILTSLAVPIETDLIAEEVQAFLALHTNKPYSTIFNSAGADQKIEYVADTKAYIDNKFTELQNAILSTGGNV